MIPGALDQLFLIDNFLDDFIVDLSTVSHKVLLTHLSLLLLELFDVFELLELFVHLDGDVAEDVEHHGDDNVEDNPLNDNIEEHEVDAGPILAASTAHHVCDRRPVVDNHESVEGHDARAEVIEVDEVVQIVGNAILAVEPWLLNFTSQSIDAPDREDVKDDIEAGELIK